MNLRFLWLVLIGVNFIILFFNHSAYAINSQMGTSYKLYKKGNLESSFHWETLYTDSNYNDDVDTVKLFPEGSYFRNYNMDLTFRLNSSSNTAWKWGVQIAAINAQSVSTSNTQSAINGLIFGIDHKFDSSGVDFIIDGDIIASPYRVSVDQTTAVVGDGANILQGKLQVQKKWPGLIGYAYGGYVLRDSGMSDYVPVGIGMQWGIYDWIIGGEIKGALLALEDDQFKPANSKRHLLLNKVNVGSYKYYSTNPEWFTAEIDLKFKLTNQFAFKGGLGTTLIARNFAQGSFIFLGLDMQWPAFLETPDGKSPVQKIDSSSFEPDIE